MPITPLEASLCSRQRDALIRLLTNQGITQQDHDIDSLLHVLLVRMQHEGWAINTRGRLVTPAQNEAAGRAMKEAARKAVEGPANTTEKADALQPGYIGYMERGESYNRKLKGKGRASEENEEDTDPHFIEEDAVFEFWLANIWTSTGGKVEEVPREKKKQFSDIWRGLCGGGE